MIAQIVIGLGFGDEGKGVVVDSLCNPLKKSIVIRFSGGHQVSHTVLNNQIKHTFSNFGSGTLKGIPTYWSSFCTIDPQAVWFEYKDLQSKGITPILYIDENCPITTLMDKIANQQNNNHGTCGVGFGKTLEREKNNYSLKISDLQYESIFKIKYNLIKQYYNIKTSHEDDECFFAACNFLKNNFIFVNDFKFLYSFTNLILEGSQGLLLDQKNGFFPHVTRSNTNSFNANMLLSGIGFQLKKSIQKETFYVTRAYQTRHGNGPMTNEDIPHNIQNKNEVNKTNIYQGNFRTSLLDLDLLKYAIHKNNVNVQNNTLVITCLEHIQNEYRFTENNKIIYCNNEKDFIQKIVNKLGFKKLLLIKDHLIYGCI
jgi:adenylosuccinate synthase